MQNTNTAPERGAQPGGAQPANSGGKPPQQGAQLPQQGLTSEQLRKMQVMSKQAMEFLLEEQTAQQIVERARSGDPKEVVAGVVLMLMQRLYEVAKDAGQMQGGDGDMVTMMVTGLQVIGDLAEMLVAAGVIPQQQAPQFIAETSAMAIQQHNAQVQGAGGMPAQGGAA